jgi:hypothetical protein
MDVPLLPGSRPRRLAAISRQLPSPLTQVKSKLCYCRLLVGQSILVSIPIWGLKPDLCYCQTVTDLLMWGTPLTRGLICHLLLVVAGTSNFVVRVPWYSWAYFTLSNSRLPQPGGLRLCIYIPQGQCGPVIPTGTGRRPLVLVKTPRDGPHRKHCFQPIFCCCVRICCYAHVSFPRP